jgi:hypothetical protein
MYLYSRSNCDRIDEQLKGRVTKLELEYRRGNAMSRGGKLLPGSCDFGRRKLWSYRKTHKQAENFPHLW